MNAPVLLVAGYLGAGKTTLLNHLLANPGGRRIAAIVNDFGAIDIDAALLGAVTDDVISLKNGCICCSLQSDLLRTLANILKRDDPPNAIVIETSGISDPAEIMRSLMDPIIFRVAPLETVVTLVDVRRVLDQPDLGQDPLWRSQLRAADFVLLTKTDLIASDERDRIDAILGRDKPKSAMFEIAHGVVAPELLFGRGVPEPRSVAPARPSASLPFVSVTWTSQGELSLERFQRVITAVAARTLRAKGVMLFAEHPGRPMLFQCVGTRATMAPSPFPLSDGLTAQLVMIGRDGEIDAQEIDRLLMTIVVV